MSLIFFVDTEVHKKQRQFKSKSRGELKNTRGDYPLPLLFFLYLANEISGMGNMITINKSQPREGQFHWKEKQKKAEGKSPDVGCTKHDMYLFSVSQAWCLKIAEISEILNKKSRKIGGFWAAHEKLRGKEIFNFL